MPLTDEDQWQGVSVISVVFKRHLKVVENFKLFTINLDHQ